MSGASNQPSDPNSSRPSGASVRRQPDRIAHFVHRPSGDGAGALATGFEDGVDLLARELCTPLAERREALDDALGKDSLLLLATDLRLPAQVPVVLPAVEEEFVEGTDVAGSWMAGVRFAWPLHVGDHAHDLLPNHVRRVGDADDVFEALRHLCLAIGAFDDRGVRVEHDPRLGEHRAIGAVEAPSYLSRALDMGSLLATHGNQVAFDDDDDGRLKDGVLEG